MRILVALLAVAFALAAQATPVAIANLAPDTAGGSGVEVHVDGVAVVSTLGYKGLLAVDLDATAHRLEIFSAATGATLLDQTVVVQAAGDASPTIAFIGNGFEQPHEAVVLAAPADAVRGALSIVHAAAYAGEVQSVDYDFACTRSDGSGFAGNAQTLAYRGAAFYDDNGSGPPPACSVDVSGFPVGNLRIENLQLRAGAVLRAYLIGDGRRAPFELIAAIGAELVAGAAASVESPLPELTSTTIWSDRDRPAEGIAVYEVGLSGNVAVTWFTFGADTKPVWYYLDGIPAAVPGWRDLVVFRVDREGGVQHTVPVGSARLIYQDCNNANLRIVLGQEFRSLRLRRTVADPRCAALD